MCIGTARMAMYFNAVTLSGLGQGRTILLHRFPNTQAAGMGINGKITDAGKITREGNLGDDVERNKGNHLILHFSNKQDFIRMLEHFDQFLREKVRGARVAELGEESGNCWCVGGRGLADVVHGLEVEWNTKEQLLSLSYHD